MPIQPSKTVYVPTGNADTVAVAPATYVTLGYNQGEMGLVFEQNGNQYQETNLDSGATSATPIGVVAANQLAYWKDKGSYLVTNDYRFAVGGQTSQGFANNVAGIFRNAVPANPTINGYGTMCMVLQKGRGILVKTPTSLTTANIGDAVVANTSSPAADATNSAAGTAPPNQRLGEWRGASSAGSALADLDIPNIE
jgi:hypothetical protein